MQEIGLGVAHTFRLYMCSPLRRQLFLAFSQDSSLGCLKRQAEGSQANELSIAVRCVSLVG